MNHNKYQIHTVVKQQNTVLVVLGALSAIAPLSVGMYLLGFPAIARGL